MEADKNKMSKSNFMQVSFQNISESYNVDANVECVYVINRFLEVGSRDWIGLYKVGWRTPTEYIYYEWSPVPQNYVAGKEIESKVTFPAPKLPKDDGEFYQFCYVTASGHVRGASAPFQFKQPSLDDFIEIEDENGELLVIRTKTAVLEDQLKKANELRGQLKQKIQILENEKDLLVFTERDVEKKLQREKEENELLQEKLTCMAEMVTDLHHEADDLQACAKALQEKIEFLNQEKSSMEKRLDDNDAYIVSLQEKIKSLVTEKDALVGRTKVLEEEKELYRNHVSSSESNLQSYHKECERLRARLTEADGINVTFKRDIEGLEQHVEEQNDILNQQIVIQRANKESIEDLSERLRNAEDKLSAAEHCKMMLNEEVLTLRLAYEKMSADLEMSNSEVDSMKGQLVQLESRLSAERDDKSRELEVVKSQLAQKTEESVGMSAEMESLRRKAEDQARSDEAGPMYALQMAQMTLKERYGKMTKKNEGLQKSLEMAHQRLQQLEEIQTDQKDEIETLTKRLELGKDAYQEKFIECERLQAELGRVQQKPEVPPRCREAGRGAAKTSSGLASKRVPEPPQKSIELQTSMISDALTSSEMQLQLDDVLKELTACRARTTQQEAYITELTTTCLDKSNAIADLMTRNKLIAAHSETRIRVQADEIKSLKEQLRQISARPPQPIPAERPCGAVGQCAEITPTVGPTFYNSDAIKRFDPLATDETQKLLPPALRPLPPPIQPEILPSAKVAQLKATISHGNLQMFSSMDQFSPDMLVEGPDVIPAGPVAGAVIDEEKFEDAPGEPQRSCPTCQCVFHHDMSIGEMTLHIETHFDEGPICPMCDHHFAYLFPADQFQAHVNSHFN